VVEKDWSKHLGKILMSVRQEIRQWRALPVLNEISQKILPPNRAEDWGEAVNSFHCISIRLKSKV